ncbi:MAG: GNAT family protein [Pseudomonadales bacterium]
MELEKTILEGQYVRLEPLAEQHKEGLCHAIYDGELWKLFVTLVPHPNKIDEFLDNAEKAFLAGDGLAFATIDKSTNQVVGSTRFMRADLPNKSIEIGFTFLGNTWHRTRINTEAKYLMFSHAFDTLGLNRVGLLIDFLNHNSRNAILRLGAKEEGVLRNHMVMPDGRIRDSVLYSVIANEWPGVKQLISGKLV